MGQQILETVHITVKSLSLPQGVETAKQFRQTKLTWVRTGRCLRCKKNTLHSSKD